MKSNQLKVDNKIIEISDENYIVDLEEEATARRINAFLEFEAMFKDTADNADKYRLEAIEREEQGIKRAIADFKADISVRKKRIESLKSALGTPCDGLFLAGKPMKEATRKGD